MRKRSWPIRLFALSGLALVGLGGVAVVALPAGAAYACPQCYGLKPVGGRIYVERSMVAAEIAELRLVVAEAETRVRDFFGELGQTPALMVCATETCDRRLGGGGAKARTYGARFVHVSPAGRNPMILSHELSHIEVRTRIGEVRSMVGGVPAWFGEGLAVIISRDQRYLAFDGDGEIRCRHEPEGDLPTTGTEWRQQAGKGKRPLYAMAACRTLGWMKKNGGREGVLSTLARIGQGGAFSE